MGMFDELRCKYPLPPDGVVVDAIFQTKDLPAMYLDMYEIRADGSLWHEEYDIEDRSDPTAEGFERVVGCMTRVNKRWVMERLTGDVVFYGGTVCEDVSFKATFEDGGMVSIVEYNDF